MSWIWRSARCKRSGAPMISPHPVGDLQTQPRSAILPPRACPGRDPGCMTGPDVTSTRRRVAGCSASTRNRRSRACPWQEQGRHRTPPGLPLKQGRPGRSPTTISATARPRRRRSTGIWPNTTIAQNPSSGPPPPTASSPPPVRRQPPIAFGFPPRRRFDELAIRERPDRGIADAFGASHARSMTLDQQSGNDPGFLFR
jgi:hypothetical protein